MWKENFCCIWNDIEVDDTVFSLQKQKFPLNLNTRNHKPIDRRSFFVFIFRPLEGNDIFVKFVNFLNKGKSLKLIIEKVI